MIDGGLGGLIGSALLVFIILGALGILAFGAIFIFALKIIYTAFRGVNKKSDMGDDLDRF